MGGIFDKDTFGRRHPRRLPASSPDFESYERNTVRHDLDRSWPDPPYKIVERRRFNFPDGFECEPDFVVFLGDSDRVELVADAKHRKKLCPGDVRHLLECALHLKAQGARIYHLTSTHITKGVERAAEDGNVELMPLPPAPPVF